MSKLDKEYLQEMVNSIIRLDDQRDTIANTIVEKIAELKAHGYDSKAVKKIVADSRKDIKKILDAEEIVNLYRSTLGIGENL